MQGRDEEQLKKGYNQARFIGFAMIASVFIYAAVVEVLKMTSMPFKGPIPQDMVELLRYLFFGITLLEFLLIRFSRKFILSKKAETSGVSNGEASSSAKISKLMSATIVTYALCESVALFGLILFMLGGNSLDFYIFMILSLLLFAMHFPRYPHWEDWIGRTRSEPSKA